LVIRGKGLFATGGLGIKRGLTSIVGVDQLLLVLAITIYPDTNADEVATLFTTKVAASTQLQKFKTNNGVGYFLKSGAN
jgi:hypothetical protein